MNAGGRIPLWVIALLAFLCLAVLSWTTFGFVVPFKHETGQVVLDTYFAGYDQPAVDNMERLLGQNEVAAHLLRAMYFGPELIFPALLTALLFLILVKLEPGGTYFGRPVRRNFVKAVYLLPFLYGIADYSENIVSLIAFSDPGQTGLPEQILPWMTRLKFASLVICAILIVRFAIFRILPRRNDGSD
jgi:hypothetical protein